MTKLEVFNQAKDQLSKTHELTIDSENQFKLTIDGWDLVFKNTYEHNTVQAFSVDGVFDTELLHLDDAVFEFLSKNIVIFINQIKSQI